MEMKFSCTFTFTIIRSRDTSWKVHIIVEKKLNYMRIWFLIKNKNILKYVNKTFVLKKDRKEDLFYL